MLQAQDHGGVADQLLDALGQSRGPHGDGEGEGRGTWLAKLAMNMVKKGYGGRVDDG